MPLRLRCLGTILITLTQLFVQMEFNIGTGAALDTICFVRSVFDLHDRMLHVHVLTGEYGFDPLRKSGSLSSLITESYIREKVKVPSAIAKLIPRIDMNCPRVLVYAIVPREDSHIVSLPPFLNPLLSKNYLDFKIVGNLSSVRLVNCYTSSFYGELAQNLSCSFDLELVVHVHSTPKDSADSSLCVINPIRTANTKAWLHPSDIDMFFPSSQVKNEGQPSRRRTDNKPRASELRLAAILKVSHLMLC